LALRCMLYGRSASLVRALSLYVTRLLALVASALAAGLRWAIAFEFVSFVLAESGLLTYGSNDRPRHNCSIFVPECSLSTCGRNLRKSSRSVHLGDRRSHLHLHTHLVDHHNRHHRSHRPQGSFVRYDRSWSTTCPVSVLLT